MGTHRKKFNSEYGHRLYRVWASMKSRCSNKNEPSFKDYGGRGIKVFDEWLSFDAFEKDMAPTYKPGLSIDRIDNNGNYCKENCRWATSKEQSRNRRNTRIITFQGKSMILEDWAREIGISKETLIARIYQSKWSIKNAFEKQVGSFRKPNNSAIKFPRGNDVKVSKLTEEKVKTIRQEISSGMTNSFLGRKYGVSANAISLIKRNQTWKHI